VAAKHLRQHGKGKGTWCGRDVNVHVNPDFDPTMLAQPLLCKHDVSEEVEAIANCEVASPAAGFDFVPFIDWFSGEIGVGNDLQPSPGKKCKRCEFYCSPDQVSDRCRSG